MFLSFFFVLLQSAAFEIAHKFLKRRHRRHGKDDAKEPGEFSADDEREDDEKRRYADDAGNDERIDELAFELLRNDVNKYSDDAQRHAACNERDHDGRNRREDRPEDRDYLEACRDDREDERVGDAEYSEHQID